MTGDTGGSSDNYIVKYNKNGTIQWATKIGGDGKYERPVNLKIDSNNHIIVSGRSVSETINLYNGALNIDNSIPINPKITMIGDGNTEDNYIVKYSTDGSIKWATKVGGDANKVERPVNLQIDLSNNVIVNGRSFSNTIKLYDGKYPDNNNNTIPITPEITMNGSTNLENYIIKYDGSDGKIVWATKIGGSNDEEPVNLEVDSDENIIVSGYSKSNIIDLYNGTGPNGNTIPLGQPITMTGSNSNSFNDNYIVKYNKDGIIQWATKVGGDKNEKPINLQIDNNKNIIINGSSSSNTIDLYNGSAPNSNEISLNPKITMIGQSNSYTDNYIVKYNTDGVIQWATKVGGDENERPVNLKIDKLDNTIISGYSTSNIIDLYNGSSPNSNMINLYPKITMIGSNSNIDNYIVKYNTDGVIQWATKIGGSDTEKPANLQFDMDGHIIVSGLSNSDTIDLYNGSAPNSNKIMLNQKITMISNVDEQKNYIVKYDGSNGTIIWATTITGNSEDEFPFNLEIDSLNDIIVSGYSSSSEIYLYDGKAPYNQEIPIGPKIIMTGDNNSTTDNYIVKFSSNLPPNVKFAYINPIYYPSDTVYRYGSLTARFSR